jgi:hypothetical protein
VDKSGEQPVAFPESLQACFNGENFREMKGLLNVATITATDLNEPMDSGRCRRSASR